MFSCHKLAGRTFERQKRLPVQRLLKCGAVHAGGACLGPECAAAARLRLPPLLPADSHRLRAQVRAGHLQPQEWRLQLGVALLRYVFMWCCSSPCLVGIVLQDSVAACELAWLQSGGRPMVIWLG